MMVKKIVSGFFVLFSLVVYSIGPWAFGQDEKVPEYYKRILDNGAVLAVYHMTESPLTTIQFRVLGGLSNEGKYAGTGISHLIEHMIFRAVDEDGIMPIRKEVKAMGGVINGSTGQDSAEYHITVPTRHFRQALEILARMVMDPVFDEDGFDIEKSVILKEMNMLEDDPGRKIIRELFENAYRHNVYKFPIIGYRDLFLKLERSDLEEYHSAVYTANRIVIGVAGGIYPEEVFTAVEEVIGKYTRGNQWAGYYEKEPRQMAPNVVTAYSDVSMGYIAMGFHSASVFSSDMYPLDVAAFILGDGQDSMLYRRLVREKQLLYSVSALNLTPRFPGLFIISGTGEPDKLSEAREEIFRVISGLNTEAVSSADVEKSRNTVVSSYLRAHESTYGIVSSMTGSTLLTGDPGFLKDYVGGIKAVTSEDIAGAAGRYLNEPNSTTVYMVPESLKPVFTGGEERSSPVPHKASDVKEKKLNNGLRLLARKTGSMPLLSVTFVSRAGLLSETVDDNGISNLTASLLLKGTGKRSESDIISGIEGLGGQIYSFSGLNSLGVSMDLMAGDLEKGMEIFSDVLMDPVFHEDELKKEKNRIIADIREQEKDIFSVALLCMRKLIFPGHPYSLRSEGEIEVLEKLDASMVRKFYRDNIVPEGSVICVAGDIDTDSTIELLSRIFASWEVGPGSEGKALTMAEREAASSRIVMNKQQSIVAVGFRGVTVSDERKYVLDVISSLLSGSDGLLFDMFREEEGLAYTSGVSHVPGLDQGYFVVYAATTREKLSKARGLILDAVKTVISGEITDHQIQSSKERSITDQERSMEGNSAVSSTMALSELYGLGSSHYEGYASNVSKVTRGDITRVAGEILDTDFASVIEISSDL